jgi:hypothetical protein
MEMIVAENCRMVKAFLNIADVAINQKCLRILKF